MSSSEIGNTSSISPSNDSEKKRVNPAKHWCFTLWDYTDIDIKECQDIGSKKCNFYVFGKEHSKEGRPHLQGYFSFEKKIRPKGLISDKVHWEVAKGNKEQNTKYCIKEGDYCINGIWNEKIKTISREQMYEWQKDVLTHVEEEPDDRIIYYYWDEEGSTGKSALCKYICVNYPALIVSGKGNDIKYAIIKWHEERKYYPKVILVDTPRSVEKISWTAIEEVKNGLFFCGKYESSQVIMNSPTIIMFSNEGPAWHKLSRDRWKVVHIPSFNSLIAIGDRTIAGPNT